MPEMDVDRLERLLGTLSWTRTGVVDGRRVIALDGKSVRGAKRGVGSLHLVAASTTTREPFSAGCGHRQEQRDPLRA